MYYYFSNERRPLIYLIMTATTVISRSITNALIHKAVASNASSKLYIERLLPSAIGFIVHQRMDYDGWNFDTLSRNGIMYKSFKMKVVTPEIIQLCQWIRGALDAFRRNYLKELYLFFVNTASDNSVVESYKFIFTYRSDSSKQSKVGREEKLRNSTDELFIAISKLNGTKLKSAEVTPVICLIYQDDAPKNYHPPYFKEDSAQKAKDDEFINTFSNSCKQQMTIGYVDTSFHSLKCLFVKIQPSNTEEKAVDIQSQSSNRQLNVKKVPSIRDLETQTVIPRKRKRNDLETDSSYTDQDAVVPVLDNNFKCSCLLKANLRKIDIIKCSRCSLLQHTPCVGFLYVENITGSYICKFCKEKTELSKENQLVSIFRLLLAYVYLNNCLPHKIIDIFPKHTVTEVVQQLQSIRVIRCIDGRYAVGPCLTDTVKKFFGKMDSKNNKLVLPTRDQ